MDNMLAKLMWPFVKKWALKKIETEKDDIINWVNLKIDLPDLDEEQEKKHIENVYNVARDLIRDYLK